MDVEVADRWWWQEYPVRDREYVRWYPPDLRPMTGEQLWANQADCIPGAFGIYLHIPFCEVICPFCPYHKAVATEDDATELTAWLIRELELYKRYTTVTDQPVHFIYFGGGTPSILPPRSVDDLLGHIDKNFKGIDTAEITMEINPGFISEDKLRSFRSAGLNRVSFGIQSFDDRWLKVIGSHHSAADAVNAIGASRKVGFENVGIDLLFRLPGQTLSDWSNDISKAIAQDFDHISTYSMVVDPDGGLGHQLASGKLPQQPDEEADLAMSLEAFERFGAAGLYHYASCASCGHDFARPGRESKYEVLHWGAPQASYIGIGPGAYGFVNDHIYCTLHNQAQYQRYLANGSIPVVAAKRLSRLDAMARYFVLGVKCVNVDFGPFRTRFGEDPMDVFREPIAWLNREGLAELTPSGLKVTQRGVLYMDNVSKAFYSPETKYCPQPLEHDIQALSRQVPISLTGAVG